MTDFVIASGANNGTAGLDNFFLNAFVSSFTVDGLADFDTIISNPASASFLPAGVTVSNTEAWRFGTNSQFIFVASTYLVPATHVTGNGLAQNWFTIRPFDSGTTSFDGSQFTFDTFAGADQQVRIDFSTIPGGATLTGTVANTVFTTGPGADVVTAVGSAINSAFLAGGNDSYTAGAGLQDKSAYSGNRTDYLVTQIGPNQYTVADLRSGAPEGTDTLTNVEEAVFADGAFQLSALVAQVNQPPHLNVEEEAILPGNFAWPVNKNNSFSVAHVFGDVDGDTLTFTAKLANGDPLPAGFICTADGVLSWKPPAKYHKMTFNVVVTADDGHGGTEDATVSIPINDDPQFSFAVQALLVKAGGSPKVGEFKEFVDDSDIPKAPATQHEIAAVADAAPDIAHQHLSFSIIGGLDKGDFKIAAKTGVLSFKTVPDFAHPKDSNHDNLYKVKIRVSDGFQLDDALIKVKVINNPAAKVAAVASMHDALDLVPKLDGHHHADWLFDA